ncbi:MAG: hypothetical protein NTV05_12855 [Acidobacteria bacterium]|nr:hypothetical protein [Acidobacteriota bacterium]
MKKFIIAVLCLVVLAGAGFAAYRLGLLDRFTGTTRSGESPATVATPGSPTPGDPAAKSSPSATGAQPASAVSDTAPASVASDAAEAAAATPIPPGLVATAQVGQSIANKAIEVRVTNHRTAASIGRQSAAAGREFVIVDTAWKSLIPPQKVNQKRASDRTAGMGSLGFGGGATAQDKAADEANTTIEQVPFAVGPMTKHVWLVADGRYTEGISVDATQEIDGHLPTGTLTIPGFEQVVSGSVAFEVPANAQSLALLFLDSINGHLLLTIKGAPPVLASSLGGSSRANTLVDLALAGVSWADAPPSAAGMRTLIVGLRGISRQNAIVDVPFGGYAFLQTEQGCLAEPDQRATGLTRQLAPIGRFLPFVPSEGQLAFLVPADTKAAALLVRLRQGGPIDLAVMGAVKPAWPSPEATITDGDVLRVLKLPGTAVPPGLPAARSGSERIALDLVVENLRSGAGIDLQLNQQFRLVGPDDKRYTPSSDSAHAPCRMTGNVVPAGSSRRFTLVFDVPPGEPLQFEYRGFNVKSELVKVR